MSQHEGHKQFETSSAKQIGGKQKHRDLDVVLRNELIGCFPHAGLGAAAARVAWVLMHSYNVKEGCARSSREVIADEIGTSVRQADNLIAEVLEYGLFTHESGRQHYPNHYYPNWPLIDRLVPPDGDRQMYAARRAAFRAKKAVQALETDLNGDTSRGSRRKLSAQPKPAADGAGALQQMVPRAEDPCIQTGNFLPPDLKLSASRQEETCIQTRKKLPPNPSVNPGLETGYSNPSLGNPCNDVACAPPVHAPTASRLGEKEVSVDLSEEKPAGKRLSHVPPPELRAAYDRLMEVWPGTSHPIGTHTHHRPALGEIMMQGWTIGQILHRVRQGKFPEGMHIMSFFRVEFDLKGKHTEKLAREDRREFWADARQRAEAPRSWVAGVDEDDDEDRRQEKHARRQERRFPSEAVEHAPF